MKLTGAQEAGLRQIAAGFGIVGMAAPNGNVCRSLLKKELIDGRGWASDPYRLTAAGAAALGAEVTEKQAAILATAEKCGSATLRGANDRRAADALAAKGLGRREGPVFIAGGKGT